MAKTPTKSPKAKSPKSQEKKKTPQKDVAVKPVTVAAEENDEWEDEVSEMQIDAAQPQSKKDNRKSRRADKQKPKTNKKGVVVQEEDEGSDDESDDEDFQIDFQRIDDTDSDSEIGDDDDDDEEEDDDKDGEEDEDEEDDEEEDLDLDDISVDEEDEENIAASARVRETINNKEGLLAALKRFALDTSPKVPFAYHQSVVSSKATAEAIPSVDDDIVRELAFMNQALEAARKARTLLLKEKVPFTRPNDYFAETLRSDEIMDKVKGKMIEDATAKKASAEARKQRELKKFGKQVQVAKQQERAKEKRETLDKINLLKRKRKENGGVAGANEEDMFDVAVENELKSAGNNKKRSFGGGEASSRGPPNAKRQKKDSKYGHGGKKKHIKSGDAVSSGDLSGFSAKRMKSGDKPGGRPGGRPGGAGGARPVKARLGKTRRKAQAGKR